MKRKRRTRPLSTQHPALSTLKGRRIVVTRSRRQAARLVEALEARGAEVIEFPTIEIRDPEDSGPLDRAAAEAGNYDLVIFTSANGVERFLARNPSAIRGKICAIGPATASVLERAGLDPDFVPQRYIAEGVLEALKEFPLAGKRVLIPRAAVARDLIPRELQRRGAHVDVVEAYRTVVPDGSVKAAERLLKEGADLVTFTSPSTVMNFSRLLPEGLPGVKAATIGPITTEAAEKAGWEVATEAREYTVEGLVKAIVSFYSQ